MCTNITLNAKDGSIVMGRTNEFGALYYAEMIFIPRNHELKTGWVPETKFTYKNKYSYMYASMNGIIDDDEIANDGLNEKGLAISVLYFHYQDYRTLKPSEVEPHHINVVKSATWMLGNIADIDELKERADELEEMFYFDSKMSQKGLGLHLAIADQKGNRIVIEFENKKMNIKENPLGVLTNSSPLEWHHEHLRSYSHLTQFEAKPTLFKELPENKLLTLGNGLMGMPGDFTANSRFVRAAIFTSIVEEQEDATEAVRTTFRILNTSDIVPGFTLETKSKKEFNATTKLFKGSLLSKTAANTFADHTDFFIVKDLTNLKVYYKTYNNISIRMADLDALKNTKKVVRISMAEDKVPEITEVKLK